MANSADAQPLRYLKGIEGSGSPYGGWNPRPVCRL
jgi:hypothetical protein